MILNPRTLALIQQRLEEAQRNIQYIQKALEDAAAGVAGDQIDESIPADGPGGERVIEGVFDGQNMHGNDGEEYPVPPNYASKSKLVEGDIMKLTVGANGSFVYKQIGPVQRKRVVGLLTVDDQGNFGVKSADATYSILLASVTFYKAEEGDEVTVLLPEHGEAKWGAVDNVIHKH